jgi:hypothetical protein
MNDSTTVLPPNELVHELLDRFGNHGLPPSSRTFDLSWEAGLERVAPALDDPPGLEDKQYDDH